ncbi:MAG: hypothetical protein M3478_03795 [Planctomycetota bacterium]|nr:hypothetical protein [Planctomycetota bacterium]
MMKSISLLTASLLLAGCGRTTAMVLGPDHPASPDAPVAAVPPPSTTLAVTNAPASPPPADAHAGHGPAPMNHAGHGATHTNHAGHGAAHGRTAASQPSAESPTTQAHARVMHVCPMHPKVISTNPNDRCPECNMKINKPVKQGAAPSTAPATPAGGGHAGHGDEHGGH